MDFFRASPWTRQWSKRLLGTLPCRCSICRQPAHHLLCERCYHSLSYHQNYCWQCGEELTPQARISQLDSFKRCGRCISQAPPIKQTLFAYFYDGPMVNLIQQYKFSEALILSRVLAQMVVNRVYEQSPGLAQVDILIPIPLHTSRLRQRGFNQSLELARHIGKALEIPVNKNILVRRRSTPKQSGLSKRARLRNIQGAFRLNKRYDRNQLNGKHLVIVDDVITTGATTHEAAKVLNRTHPASISIFAVAKTPKL